MTRFIFHAPLGRTLLVAMLPAIMMIALTGCGTTTQNAIKAQNYLMEAQRHAQVDATDQQARVWANRAIAVEPQNLDTYVGSPDPNAIVQPLSIAAVFASIGDDSALADYMQEAIQKFPEDDRAYRYRIDALNRLGQISARQATAVSLVNLLTKRLAKPGTKDIPGLTEAIAQAYCDSGDMVNGAAWYKKAIGAYPLLASYPNDTGPYNGLAYAYAVANIHLPEALALAQKALALAERSNSDDKGSIVAAIQDTLGWVQHGLGDNKNAQQNLEQAASSDPRQPEVRYHLGVVYAAEGKTDAARSEFGHALLIASGYAAARTALSALPKSSNSS